MKYQIEIDHNLSCDLIVLHVMGNVMVLGSGLFILFLGIA